MRVREKKIQSVWVGEGGNTHDDDDDDDNMRFCRHEETVREREKKLCFGLFVFCFCFFGFFVFVFSLFYAKACTCIGNSFQRLQLTT